MTKPLEPIEFVAVGARFRPNGVEIVRSLQRGCKVRLQREPRNQYDRNAIKLLFNDQFFGYVPREIAKIIAPALDKPTEFIVTCCRSQAAAMGHCSVTVKKRSEMPPVWE